MQPHTATKLKRHSSRQQPEDFLLLLCVPQVEVLRIFPCSLYNLKNRKRLPKIPNSKGLLLLFKYCDYSLGRVSGHVLKRDLNR
ncbi:AKR_HP2_G0023520.mRNA.1.CDS.1 [Saccharomyces cerevisiae]|nr:AKR_HP2_G0023520.mRNA.1.CDS.1 [Saccharomyces cerevisiae]CAI6472846.1 AKR_HP2_G0023520.mRNA.1.CDS.1 [Saccharomyces cerevisiae]